MDDSDQKTAEAPALGATEVQQLKELLARSRDMREVEKAQRLPELPITDADRDRFAEHLWAGDPFTQDFDALEGKLSATLRLRTKAELDLINRQLDQDYRDGLYASVERRNDLANAYNLRFQLVSLNGAAQDTAYPRRDPKMNVRRWTEESVVETLSEARLAILLNWLFQFEHKVTRLWREATAPNFTEPAAGT